MHQVLDAISLELARRIATRLLSRPELIEVTRKNLRRWSARNANSPGLLRSYHEWQAILEKPLEEVVAILCAETDEGQRLRQNTPFAGILTPEEVLEIKQAFRARERLVQHIAANSLNHPADELERREREMNDGEVAEISHEELMTRVESARGR